MPLDLAVDWVQQGDMVVDWVQQGHSVEFVLPEGEQCRRTLVLVRLLSALGAVALNEMETEIC